MSSPTTTTARPEAVPRDTVVIRFAGDSGDGMQLTGTQFTMETALIGNDLATFPDYPAEIRAPAGTTFGVSAFQIHFGAIDVMTPGDDLDVLVALNPAALKVNIGDLRMGGMLVVDHGAFNKRNLAKAGYEADPLESEGLAPFQVLKINISERTLGAVAEFELGQKEALRSRNMWTLGLMLWMFGRDKETTVNWLRKKFAKNSVIAEANIAALNAGHAFGETVEMPSDIVGFTVPKADVAPGEYRTVTGTETMAWGLVAGARAARLKIFFGSYPITPASSLLHALARLKSYGVVTFQAEDEIAAVCSAIGASYAGSLGVTSSSGPGVALKGEALGLAVAAELPLILVNSQRAGPSTGMPTKTEQSDLYQSVYGRNADSPMPVIACATPGDCFEVGMEAVRIATKYMTPVTVLADGYLFNAAEPWLIPDVDDLPEFPVQFRTAVEGFEPFGRDSDTLARPWVKPGTPGLEHRVGGIERQDGSGNISYDPENHQHMTDMRRYKIAGIADDIPMQHVCLGEDEGLVALVAWGSTYGAVHQATRELREDGIRVSHIHIRYLNPFPHNLGELLGRFEHVLVPELNTGQLVTMLRSTYLIPAEGVNKVQGKPFKIAEVVDAVRLKLELGPSQ
jgi:2-oxoglutarate ferredoxin oxidoreductase subunit alpha